MAITARTWVEGELATAAKLNTVRDDLLELDAVAGFHDTQKGTITIPNGSSSNTATISAVSPRAQLRFLGGTSSTGTQLSRIELTNATTVTATRQGTADPLVVSYEVSDPRG